MRIKNTRNAILFAALGMFSLHTTAQKITMPAPSPLQTVTQKFGLGEVTIEYTQPPNASNATLVQCDPDVNSLAVFNLRTIDALITNNNNQWVVNYFETLSEAQNFTNSISNPNSYNSGATTIFAVVTNTFGCNSIVSVILEISNATANVPQPYQV